MISKHRPIFLMLIIVVLGYTACRAKADPFSNLDFEDSPIPANASFSSSVSTSQLFPSWTLRFGDAIQTTAFLNGAPLSGAAAALVTSGTESNDVLQGTRSLYLQSGILSDAVSIDQTGDVPLATQTLRFLTRNSFFDPAHPTLPGLFELLMNGQSVPLIALFPPGKDELYGADVSAWAGTTTDLRIVLDDYLLSYPAYSGAADIDSISFSTLPVPEPTDFLMLFPASLIIFRRRQKI